MSTDEFYEVISVVAEVGAEDISLLTSLDSLGWDSLCQLGLIAELDTRNYSVPDAQMLESAKTIGDLYRVISSS